MENGSPENEDVPDFFNSNNFLMDFFGFGRHRSKSYGIVVWFAYLNHLTMTSVLLLTLYMADDKTVMIKITHYMILTLYASFSLTTRLFNDAPLNRARGMILRGVYRYEGEDHLEPALSEIRRRGAREARKLWNIFRNLNIYSTVLSVVVFPASNIIFLEDSDDDISPNFSIPVYVPGEMIGKFLGFCLGITYNLLNFLTVYGTSLCVCQICFSCGIQVKSEFQILGHALERFEERALAMYRKAYGGGRSGVSGDELYDSREFQDCLYACLRSSVRHHQELLRFHSEFAAFTGLILLYSAIGSALLYACNLYMLTTDLPFHIIVLFGLKLCADLSYNFLHCYIGENVLQASSNFRDQLYGIPWTRCSKKCTRLLHVMLTRTRFPLEIKALGFDFPASLQTYGQVMSAMYKIMNLVR